MLRLAIALALGVVTPAQATDQAVNCHGLTQTDIAYPPLKQVSTPQISEMPSASYHATQKSCWSARWMSQDRGQGMCTSYGVWPTGTLPHSPIPAGLEMKVN